MNAPVVARRLKSWINSYQEYTEILQSPPLFRKWAAIFFVAAAMERRMWVRTMGSNLYPNLYVLLVGPPGIGKGQAVYPGEAILREVPDMKIGPSDLTAASLIDALNEAVRRFIVRGNPPVVEFNSLTVVSRELGVLIPGWDNSLMNNLTDIYDGFTVDQKRRGKDLRIKILHPQINLLGACTPAYMNEVLPAAAWDQGFISRTIMIFHGERIAKDPFADDEQSVLLKEMHTNLLHDLKTIGSDYGQISFTVPAATAIKEWVKAGQPPEPTHQKLQYYNSRRLAHLLKLCMVASVSRSSARVIELEHYTEALNWLVEAEDQMPDIFKSMKSGGDSHAMEETWNWVWNLYAKEKRPIAQHRIVHFLRERVPAHSIMKVVEIMLQSKMLEIKLEKSGGPAYTPTPKEVRLSGGPPPE